MEGIRASDVAKEDPEEVESETRTLGVVLSESCGRTVSIKAYSPAELLTTLSSGHSSSEMVPSSEWARMSPSMSHPG